MARSWSALLIFATFAPPAHGRRRRVTAAMHARHWNRVQHLERLQVDAALFENFRGA